MMFEAAIQIEPNAISLHGFSECSEYEQLIYAFNEGLRRRLGHTNLVE